jgi:aminoglycoside N3'-acetyltransferase
MRDSDAHIMMIGVGLETCTAIHLPEEQIAPDRYLRPTIETYSCTDRHGTVHKVNTRRHWRLDRDFPKFAAPLKRKDQIQMGTIDDCPYILVSLRNLLTEVTAALEVDQNATLRDQAQMQTPVAVDHR